MAEFTPAYNKTLDNEGLYSNDPRDRGGETWKGISRNMHPKWEGWAVVDEIKSNTGPRQLSKTLQEDEELNQMVRDFYELVYWHPLMLNRLSDQETANEIFDTAINQGITKAVLYFQEALNLLNNNQKHYSDINEDGHMGEATLKAYAAYRLTDVFPGRSSDRNIRTLLKVMNGLQFQRYVDICNANPTQEVYLWGWMNRV
jgi:lysozyme family protein